MRPLILCGLLLASARAALFVPEDVPGPPQKLLVTPASDQALRVQLFPPENVKPEGVNGAPVLGYKVEVARRVDEVQRFSVTADGPLVAGGYRLQFKGQQSPCINWNASEVELEMALEELPGVDSVGVSRSPYDSIKNGFVYSVTFDGQYLVSGPQSSLIAGDTTGCLPTQPPNRLLSFQTDRVVSGVPGFTPGVWEIVSQDKSAGGSNIVGGSFDVSVGFEGVWVANTATTPVKGTIAAGSKTVATSASMLGLVNRGDRVRIAGEIFTVHMTAPFTDSALPLDSYHVRGATAATIEVMDTALGNVQVTKTSTTVTTSTDFSAKIAVGEQIRIGSREFGVTAVTTTSLTIDSVWPDDTTLHVTAFKRKKVTVSANADAAAMERAIASLPGAGTIEVSRVGPSRANGYHWLVTFESIATANCPASPCLRVDKLTGTAAFKDIFGVDCPTCDIKASVVKDDNLVTLSTITGGYAGSAIVASQEIGGAVPEVQTISTTAAANDIIGSFTITFQSSSGAVINFDDTAADVRTKLQNLATVGRLNVSRADNVQFGATWSVTFLSNMGNLPLFVVSDTTMLKGTQVAVVVQEVVRGVDVAYETIIDGLVPGQDYYVRAFARNENGYGASTEDFQQTGKGALPLLSAVAVSPDAPSITGSWPLSGSQMQLRLSSPVDHGDPVSKYLFEYAVGNSFGTPATKKLRIFNLVENDIAGTFRLQYGDDVSTMLSIDTTASSLQIALNGLPCVRPVSVTRALYVLTGETTSRVISFSNPNNRLTTTTLTTAQVQMLVKGASVDVGGNRFVVRTQPLAGSTGIDVELGHGVATFTSNFAVLKLDSSGNERGPFGYEWTVSFDNDPYSVFEGKYPGLQLISSLTSVQTSSALPATACKIDPGQSAVPPAHYGSFEVSNDERLCDTYVVGAPSSVQVIRLFAKTTITAGTFKLTLGSETTGCITPGTLGTPSTMTAALEALDFVSKVTVEEIRAFKLTLLTGSSASKVTAYTAGSPGSLTVVSGDTTVTPNGGLTASDIAVLPKNAIIRVSRNPNDFSRHSCEFVVNTAPAVGATTILVDVTGTCDAFTGEARSLKILDFHDYKVRFWGYYPTGEWPTLQFDPISFGTASCTAWAPSVVWTTNVPVYGQIHTLKYEGSCAKGRRGIQTILADAATSIGGTFTLSYMGEETGPLLFTQTGASEMRDAINAITAPGTVNVSVSQYGTYGKAWQVTFVQEEEDQDAIFIQHSRLTGQNALISVYPTVTVFTDAKQNDISGSFRIAFGGEVTEVIGFSATHNKVVQELQKLSSVDSVLALGGVNAGDIGVYKLELAADATANNKVLSNIKLNGVVIDPTRFLAIGESVVVGTDPTNTIQSMTPVDITLANAVTTTAAGAKVVAGLITKQTKPLPGFVGISFLSVISVTTGSNVFELPANHGLIVQDIVFIGASAFTVTGVNGEQVTVNSAYQGDSVVAAKPATYLCDNKLQTTEDLTSLVSVGDDLWLRSGTAGMTKYTISAMNARYLTVTGSFTASITRTRVYHVANGRKWNLVFRSYDGSLDTIDAVPGFDWRGTEARIGTRSPRSVTPNVINVGNPASIQTVLLEVVDVAQPALYTMSFAGDTLTNIAWNTINNDVKTKLESLHSVDGVSVTSVVRGGTVAHTISFWGTYPMKKLPLLVVTPGSANLNALVRGNGAVAVTKQDNLMLESSQNYAFRIFAENSKGISDSISLFQAQTSTSSVVPTPPTGVSLGEFHGPTWLSINYWAPVYSGGAEITMYRIEWDSSPNFDSSSADYGVASIQKKFEVQQVTTSYRSATGAGGTFTLSWGGHTTTALPFDCSVDVMTDALSIITDTSDIPVDPVKVTRGSLSWGFAWKITFMHNPGDLGLLVADGSLLTGDFPRISVVEVIQGVNDLAIGDFIHEVQEVFTDDVSQTGNSFTPIGGTFTLTFSDKTTGAISVAASALEMQAALQQTTTLYSIKVTKTTRSSVLQTAIWSVTFAYLRGEEMVGAGNIFTMTVASASLTGTNPNVRVANKITGSDPFRYYLTGLRPGVRYYTHVMAYNADGFGSANSPLSTAITCGQPQPPQTVTASVVDGTTLAVQWSASAGSGGLCSVDKYRIEWYRAEGTQEQQTITTSAGKGIPEIQRLVDFADSQTLSGYFKLSFRGEVTENLRWDANDVGLNSVKERLERLSTVGTVDVSRSKSSRVVKGLFVTVGTAGVTVTRDATTSTVTISAAGLAVGDTIWIAGLQRTVAAIGTTTFDVNTAIPIITVPVPVFRTAFGYSWAITFLSGHVGPQDLIQVYPSDNWAGNNPGIYVESVQKGLQPISGTFRLAFASGGISDTTPPLPHNISAVDMQTALEGLVTIGAVNVTRAANGYGYNWVVTFVSEFKNDISMLSVDGTELQGPGAKILAARTLAGVQPTMYCEKSGAVGVAGEVTVPGQLRYVISGLTTGQKYAVRVRAHSNEGYGYPSSISPAFQIPRTTSSSPQKVELLALSRRLLKLRWNAPSSNGGAFISSYRIQWNTVSDFSNVSSTLQKDITVGPTDTGPFFLNIPVTLVTNYFVRVFAINSQGNGSFGIPDPSGVAPSDLVPGQPEDVMATVLSSYAILVEWDPSSINNYEYGGDGGLPITQYMVEWDTSPAFDSPAAFALVDGTKRSFIIGGDDTITGVRSEVLISGSSYSIRVTAFNAKGAGVPQTANPSSVVVTNQPPTAPRNLTLSVASPTSVKAQWTNPMFDGGASLKSYQVEWDEQDDFSSGQRSSATIPIVREMQAVVLQSDVVNEEQFVDATVKVVNEEQVVRTTFTGVDEIQVIKTRNDAVVDEVQTVVTSATDRDEIQELRLDGDDIDEIQAIRTTVPEVLEVQQIQVGVTRVKEVQSITLVLPGAAANPATTVAGTIYFSFDSSLCTHCVKKMYQRTVNLVTALQTTNAETIVQNALKALANIDDVVVARTVTVAGADATYAYTITFTGDGVAGNVPLIGIDAAITVNANAISGIPTTATEVTAGSEVSYAPTATFTVTYTCESYSDPSAITTFSTPCTPSASNRICAGCVTDFDGSTFTISQDLTASTYVALGAKLIAGVCSFEAGVVTNTAGVSATIAVPANDVGKYCSKFSGQTYDLYKTPRISRDVPLKTGTNTISSGSVVEGLLTGAIDSVTIARAESIQPTFVGSIYTVTFRKRSGTVPLLACTAAGAVCTVSRTVVGSMISGTFKIGLISQDDATLASPTPQYTADIPWDASEAAMKSYMESTLSSGKMVFGTVSVKRTVYSPTGNKWSGGFTWQITFTSRGWDIPIMVAKTTNAPNTPTLTSAAATGTPTVAVEDATHPLNPFANSRDGNQVIGTMTFKFGTVTSLIPCQIGVNTALQTIDLRIRDTTLEAFLVANLKIPSLQIWRSAATQARGFTWTITFSDPTTPGDVGTMLISSSQLTGTGVRAAVYETVKGNQLGGTFQLSFNGETTDPISFAAPASDMQTKLNKLSTIQPSSVIVSQGTQTSAQGQVLGYTWLITFYSSVWADPTSDHSKGIPGNWYGTPTTWDAVWESGYSKAWGRHVGHTFPIICVKDGLTTTASDGSQGCLASVQTTGVGPIAGTFTVTLATTNSAHMAVKGTVMSDPIPHNAWGSKEESGNSGTSVEEILEKMSNIGDVAVSRSAVDKTNGGYQWTVTFLRDASDATHPCEQLDDSGSSPQQCNAPGDVPSMTANPVALPTTAYPLAIAKNPLASIIPTVDGTILRGDFSDFRVQGDAGTSQRFTVKVSCTNAAGTTCTGITFFSINSGGTMVGTHLLANDRFTVGASACIFQITSVDIVAGKIYVKSADCANFDTTTTNAMGVFLLLPWNADESLVQRALEAGATSSGRKVSVDRTVHGKYGEMSWLVRFISNPGYTPPGSGNLPDITTTFKPESVSTGYTVTVTQVTPGSDGLSGSFLIDFHSSSFGPRIISFDESPDRLQRKLNEMDTIGRVAVTRYKYPSTTTGCANSLCSGGWDDQPVQNPGTRGGYRWKIRFMRATGELNGFTFPPGSGNVSPLSVTLSTLLGNGVSVDVYTNTPGSSPVLGTFGLNTTTKQTPGLTYAASSDAMELGIEAMGLFGEVDVTQGYLMTQKIPGATATLTQDGTSATITGIDDVRQFIAPGDSIRFGSSSASNSLTGTNGDSPFTQVIDTSRVNVAAQSPVVVSSTIASTKKLYPGKQLRIDGLTYQVQRSGHEIQSITVTVPLASWTLAQSPNCFKLQLTRSGVTAPATACLQFNDIASNVQAAIYGLLFYLDVGAKTEDVVVSRAGPVVTTDNAGNAQKGYVYYVYFLGDTVAGDVALLTATGCSGLNTATVNVDVVTHGGVVPHQRVTLATDSGQVQDSQGYFLLSFNNVNTDCIKWGAPASDVEATVENKLPTGNVIVSRSGGGASQTELQRLRMTSNTEVTSTAGLFQLQFTLNGQTATTGCLKYGILASDLQIALNGLSNLGNLNNVPHINVTRDGDGTSDWGYGYEYLVNFRGPLSGGYSPVIGNVPQLEVGNIGRSTCLGGMVTGVYPSIIVETIREGSASFTYDIFFMDYKASSFLGLLSLKHGDGDSVCNTVSQTGGSVRKASIQMVEFGGNRDVQLLTIQDTTATGKFKLAFAGTTTWTSCLAFTATTSDVAAALVLLSSIGANGVLVSGDKNLLQLPAGYIHRITFVSDIATGNIPLLQAKQGISATCDDAASVTNVVISSAADGGTPSGAFALTNVYSGENPGVTHVAYGVSQQFSVMSDQFDVQQILVTNPSNNIAAAATYTLKVQATTANAATTSSIPWDASEVTLQNALLAAFQTALGALVVQDGDITVSRRTDSNLAPHGFIYTIYFVGASVSGNLDDIVVLAATAPNIGPTNVIQSTIRNGVNGVASLSANMIPLALPSDSKTSSRYLSSVSEEKLDIFKVNGFLWTIKFKSSLGNIPKLGQTTKTLSGGALTVVDDFIPGSASNSYVIPSLLAGINYYVHVAALTDVGIGAFTASASIAPSGTASAVRNINAGYALYEREVQEVRLAATHVMEIQEITTEAASIAEVQTLRTYALPASCPNGACITGSFAFRVPTIQTIKIWSNAAITAGTFTLQFTLQVKDTTNLGSFKTIGDVTTALPWNADAATVKNALVSTASNRVAAVTASDIIVTRDGDASADYGYGYIFQIKFIGNAVAGEIKAIVCQKTFTTTGNAASYCTVTMPTDIAMGTDTAVQQVVVASKKTLAVGSYSLLFTNLGAQKASACIPFDASASTLRSFLEGMSNIDKVFVTRDNYSADGYVGFVYRVFFHGNGVYGAMISLDVDVTACTPFKTQVNNVLAAIVATDTRLTASMVDYGGFDTRNTFVDAARATAAQLTIDLNQLPVFGDVLVSQSLVDEQGGYMWTVAFKDTDGDLPQFICAVDTVFQAVTGTGCETATLTGGNVISGSFLIESSAPIPYNANALTIKTTLEAMAWPGTVQVTQSLPSPQYGYTWAITFLDYQGDVPMLRVTSSLVGTNSKITVREVQKGNALGGSFTLTYLSTATAPISFDALATAADSNSDGSSLQEKLEALDLVGKVDVQRSSVADEEGGYSWLVTFLDNVLNSGDLPLLQANGSGLSGVGALVFTREVTKGSNAVGDQLWLSFDPPAADNGSPITKYQVRWDTSAKFTANPADVYISDPEILYRTQQVTTSAPSFAWSRVKLAIVPAIQRVTITAVGKFSLSFRGISTGVITSAVLTDITATALQTALQAVTSVGTVDISATAIVGQFLVTFTALPGTLPLLKVVPGTPAAAGNVVEVQAGVTNFRKEVVVFSCVATMGTVMFTYGTKIIEVAFNAALSVVETQLIGLFGVEADDINVFSSQATLCIANPLTVADIKIVFDRVYGNINQLVAKGTATGSDATITVNTDASIDGVYTDNPALAMSGTFQVGYQGLYTRPLNAESSADQLRYALENLDTINTVGVTREQSYQALPGKVDVTEGEIFVTCSSGEVCNFVAAGYGLPGYMIRIGGDWYTIRTDLSSPGLPSTRLYLGDLSGREMGYLGSTDTYVTVYEWTKGYVWTVDMLSVSSPLGYLRAKVPRLYPTDASVQVSGSACNKCYYPPTQTSKKLIIGQQYFVEVYAYNSNGKGAATGGNPATATPRQVPAAPSNVDLQVVSGQEIEVFFSPPALTASMSPTFNDDISSYIVQWDVDSTFKHGLVVCTGCAKSLVGIMLTVTQSLATQLSAGSKFTVSEVGCVLQVANILSASTIQVAGGHNCNNFNNRAYSLSYYTYPPAVVAGTLIQGSPPYRYLISGLVIATKYYVRVAAVNSVSVQKIALSGIPPDNRQWSDPLLVLTKDRAPDAPLSAVLYPFSGTILELQFQPSTRDGQGQGGNAITAFWIDVDTVSTFDSPGKSAPIEVAKATVPELYVGGPRIFYLTGLTTGTRYFAQVKTKNAIGYSRAALAPAPVAPTRHSDGPINVKVSTLIVSSTPIDSITATWQKPVLNGGLGLTSYKIEWWRAESLPEVQVVELKWTTPPTKAPFTLSFGGGTSEDLAMDVAPENLRSALMNIVSGGVLTVGHVEVSRSTVNNGQGYQWTVTFANSNPNAGDQPMLQMQLGSVVGGAGVAGRVYELTSGVAVPASTAYPGKQEVQVLVAYHSTLAVGGYFRLGYKGSRWTNYLPASVSAANLKLALEALPTIGVVTVNTEAILNGQVWTITFESNVGNLPPLTVESSKITPTDAFIGLKDGDNAVDGNGNLCLPGSGILCPGSWPTAIAILKLANLKGVVDLAEPGETAVGYGFYETLDAATLTYTISGLIAGQTYLVAVTAKNSLGLGIRARATPSSITPPLQVPGPPTNVAVNVNPGVATQLLATWGPPTSDGGNAVRMYRVEFDPSPLFTNRGQQDAWCPVAPTSAVWRVQTVRTSAVGTSPIASGYFRLQLTRQTATDLSDPIPWNAVATAKEEVGALAVTNSKVFCTAASPTCTSNPVSPFGRLEMSGSMQSKLNNLPHIQNGVEVTRSAAAAVDGGFTWSITFLDTGDDFVLAARNNLLTCSDPTTCSVGTYDVVVTKVRSGVMPPACVGNRIIPATGALNKGQLYNVRVSAYNVVGFGKPGVAPTPQKPMVVPGPPTAVTLAVYSVSELVVIFSPPDDNGGDTVTAYEVQWSLTSSFATLSSALVLMTTGVSAPYQRVISSLTKGTPYFVRVRAQNSQGFGPLQQSVPTKEQPYTTPSAPTQVALGITSATMLTVRWAPPSDDGGDTVTAYVVQWDVAAGFDSLALTASTTVTVSDATQRSYTITGLTPGTLYYVRVFAKNRGGLGTAQTSIPASLVPAVVNPGKPHTLTVVPVLAGQLQVTWKAPTIPYHGLPCGGTLQAPAQCPVVGTTDMVFGGVDFQDYVVQYSETSNFDNPVEVTTTALTVLLTNLVSTKTYYVQVLARNQQNLASFFCKRANTQSLLCPDQQPLLDGTIVTGPFVFATAP